MISEQLNESQLWNFFEFCKQQVGKKILIHSFLTTVKGNYNRHFTSFSTLEFLLIHFCVRFSGARAMYSGEICHYEVAIDHIVELKKTETDKYEIVEKYAEKLYRKSVFEFA